MAALGTVTVPCPVCKDDIVITVRTTKVAFIADETEHLAHGILNVTLADELETPAGHEPCFALTPDEQLIIEAERNRMVT